MGFTPDLPQKLLEDQSFIEDLARFADGVLTEKQVRQKWHFFDEAEWVTLAQSNELVEKIELEKTRRIRSGATKRELAQLHVTKAPAVLDKILSDEHASPKHRIDAAKTLDDLAGFAPQAGPEQDRVIIRIDLTAGGGEVLEFDKSIRPNPTDKANVIDAIPQARPPISDQQEPTPPRRGPGRPKGSRNKPKTKTAPQEMLPYLTTTKPTDGGGTGEPL